MKQMAKRNKRNTSGGFLIPAYGWLAALVMVSFNVFVYEGSRLFTTQMPHYDFSIAPDGVIPFIKEFIIVYFPLAYAQWIYGFYLSVKQDKQTCFRICGAEMIAKFLCLVCFLVIPTSMSRPEITGTDLFSRSVALVYKIDPPDNLFPSIHCLESYILTRTVLWLKNAPKWYTYSTVPVTLLVFASTVFLKQHVIVDIFSAILVVEIGIFIIKTIIRDH